MIFDAPEVPLPPPEPAPTHWPFFVMGMVVGAFIMQLIWIDVIYDLPACIAPTLKYAGGWL